MKKMNAVGRVGAKKRRLSWPVLTLPRFWMDFPLSFAAIASVDLKDDESGLLELAQQPGTPLKWPCPANYPTMAEAARNRTASMISVIAPSMSPVTQPIFRR